MGVILSNSMEQTNYMNRPEKMGLLVFPAI